MKKGRNAQKIADLMILFVAVSWGFSFMAMDIALTELTPITLNAFRFVGAFMVATIFAFKKMKGISKETMRYSIVLGTTLFLVYLTSTYGVKYTSLSNAGFLCAMSVVTTPLIAFLFKGVKQNKKFVFAIVVSTVGMALLMLKGSLSVAWGDVLCITTAIIYGVHLNMAETAVAKSEVDAFHLGVLQLGVAGIYNLVFALSLGEFSISLSYNVVWSVIFLSIVCTGAAFILQTIAQQYTTASRVGMIFTLEPVAAGIVAYFHKGEILSVQGYVGATMLIMSIFIMEMDFDFIRRITGRRRSTS